MDTKHTPGPWRVDRGFQNPGYIRAAGGELVASASVIYQNIPLPYRENAILIAAAPDMLAALKALVGKIDLACLVERDLDMSHAADEIRDALAAIDKAEGRS